MIANNNKAAVYIMAAEINKATTMADLQLSVKTHLGLKSASVKFCSQFPHTVPILPTLHELIPLQVSLP